ncbi:MAG TPA: type II toxin-antitoxin system RelE/ParE family toxin [Vicinamibacterales bacterium]|nr:type II toxin-antitoxin system RelE/ParE family toxin [Vicinamibacterales bacterium]
MIQSFADDATKDIYNGVNTKVARRLPKALWPIVRRKLDALNAANRVELLREPPGNHLEALKGDRAGSWSVRVNDQYRITFRFVDGHAHDVACEDYH